MNCRACDDCIYYCPLENCQCGEYFKKHELKNHIVEVYKRAPNKAKKAKVSSPLPIKNAQVAEDRVEQVDNAQVAEAMVE